MNVNISDYKHADCKLFRTPPLDLSSIEGSVEDKLLELWQQGCSVDEAIDRLSNDEKLLGVLEDQISSSIEFQKETALERLRQRATTRLNGIERIKEKRLKQIEEEFGAVTAEKSTDFKNASADYEVATAAKTAAEERLNRIRNRVKSRITEIGGKKRIEKLDEIESFLKPRYSPESDRAFYPEMGRKSRRKGGQASTADEDKDKQKQAAEEMMDKYGDLIKEGKERTTDSGFGDQRKKRLDIIISAEDVSEAEDNNISFFGKVKSRTEDYLDKHPTMSKIWKFLNYPIF